MKHNPSSGKLGELCRQYEYHLRKIFSASNVLDRADSYDAIAQPRGRNPGRRLSEEPTVVVFMGVFSNGTAAFDLMNEFIINQLVTEQFEPERGDLREQKRLKDDELCIWEATLSAISLWKGTNTGHGWSIGINDLYWHEINQLRSLISTRVDQLSFQLGPPAGLVEDAEAFSDDALDIDPRDFR